MSYDKGSISTRVYILFRLDEKKVDEIFEKNL